MNGMNDARRRAGHVRALSVAAATVALSLAVVPGAQAVTSLAGVAGTPGNVAEAPAASQTVYEYQAIEYGRDGELRATVNVDGAPAAGGEVVFTIGGEAQAPVAVEEGAAVLDVPAGRDAGYYPVTVTYAAVGVATSQASGRYKVFEADIDNPVAFQPGQFQAGESVQVVGKVLPERGNAGTPTGQVQLRVDNAQVGDIVDIAGDGSFTLDWTVPADAEPGLHRVWVRYLGDGNFRQWTFSVEGQVVAEAPAASQTVYDYHAIEYGRAGQLRATVKVDGESATSGEVVFTIGGETQAPVPVTDGQAVLDVPAGRTVGYYDVTAAYSAEGVAPSSASGRYKVFEADVDSTATFQPGEFTAGESVQITGSVTAEPGNEKTPTGQVQLWDNGPNGGPLGEPVNLGDDGSYELDWTVPADAEPGLHRVWVRYLGDGGFRRWNFYAEGQVVEAADAQRTPPGHRAVHPGKGNVPDHVKEKWAQRYAARHAG
jgi:hypothetical protein